MMTIHAAKGLEFPIIAVCDLEHQFTQPNKGAHLIPHWKQRKLDIRVGTEASGLFFSSGFEEAREEEKQADLAERLRLFYVAMTRACDHLILPLHGLDAEAASRKTFTYGSMVRDFLKEKGLKGTQAKQSYEIIPPLKRDMQSSVNLTKPDLDFNPGDLQREALELANERLMRLEMVKRQILGVHRPSRHESGEEAALRASSSAADGDYRRRLGRALHQYMAWCPLQRAMVEALSLNLAREQDVPPAELNRLIDNCLNSEIWQRALCASRLWRETPVISQREGVIVNGVIDLIWEEERGGLFLADYKTGQPETERHTKQIRDYIAAVQVETGRKAGSGYILYCSSGEGILISASSI